MPSPAGPNFPKGSEKQKLTEKYNKALKCTSREVKAQGWHSPMRFLAEKGFTNQAISLKTRLRNYQTATQNFVMEMPVGALSVTAGDQRDALWYETELEDVGK